MSDVHYEVDMQLLGNGSRHVWHELFFHIVDLVASHQAQTPAVTGGIIVCKNFHRIEPDLLSIFYSYMNHPVHYLYGVHLRFLLISDSVCFLPNSILARTTLIPVRRPSLDQYIAAVSSNQSGCKLPGIANFSRLDLSSVQNIKELYLIAGSDELSATETDALSVICTPIYRSIVASKSVRLAHLRNQLYNILIHKMDVQSVVQHLVHLLVHNGHLPSLTNLMPWFGPYFRDYNQGYRAIYHVERIFCRIWACVLSLPKNEHGPRIGWT